MNLYSFSRLSIRLSVVALAFFAAAAQAQTDATLQRARELIKSNNAQAAYELLAPSESARAGEVAFDLLLGTAAIDSGHGEQGVFALERVLAVDPNNVGARAEIARAYVLLGERENAKTELLAVRSQNISPEVRETIDKFLTGIERGPRRFNAFIEASIGMDSNINSATGSPQLAIPGLGTVTLTGPGATRVGDNFMGLTGGMNYSAPLAPDWELLAAASAGLRLNDGDNRHTAFDNNNLDGSLSARWSVGKDAVTLGLQAQAFTLDDKRFRDSAGGIAQWQHNYSDTRQASAFVQYSDLSYPSQHIRDAERTIVGVAYGEALPIRFSPVIFASLYGGWEKEINPGVPHLGHRPIGARLGSQFTLAPYTTLVASIGVEDRRYGGPEPVFNTPRKDFQTDVRLALSYKFANTWTLTPQVSLTDNGSNIGLYRYTRTVASVALRKDF